MLKMAKLEFENHTTNISLGCFDPNMLRQIFLQIAWQDWSELVWFKATFNWQREHCAMEKILNGIVFSALTSWRSPFKLLISFNQQFKFWGAEKIQYSPIIQHFPSTTKYGNRCHISLTISAEKFWWKREDDIFRVTFASANPQL